jgi:hypothetical protein
MWNFSNGENLSNLILSSTKKKPENEITGIECIFDPEDIKANGEHKKPDQIVAVGWDKKLYIWLDDKKEVIESQIELPSGADQVFHDDIMCVAYRKLYK